MSSQKYPLDDKFEVTITVKIRPNTLTNYHTLTKDELASEYLEFQARVAEQLKCSIQDNVFETKNGSTIYFDID